MVNLEEWTRVEDRDDRKQRNGSSYAEMIANGAVGTKN